MMRYKICSDNRHNRAVFGIL